MSKLERFEFRVHRHGEIREGVLPSIVAESIYDSWVSKFHRLEGMESFRLDYPSGPFRVTGLLLKPTTIPPGGCPMVIFNRGGRGRYGMLNVLTINNLLYPLVAKGYLVLASQYRGVDGGTGQDEFGGAEVEDILALQRLGEGLPEWDGRNIFMFGWSRGGMMTLLALKHGAKVNAIALGAPLVDLTLNTTRGKVADESWAARAMPDYASQPQRALEERSAPYWMDKLTTPTLLMHGTADSDVSIAHSRNLAKGLSGQGVEVELVEYEGGNHYLNRERADVLDRVVTFFNRHKSVT